MAIEGYLAMTREEIEAFPCLPENTAFLFLGAPEQFHIPEKLPEDSPVILTDLFPFSDPEAAGKELAQLVGRRQVILDFQRKDDPAAALLCQILCRTLPCPPAVSSLYAGDLPCPVFVSPVPLHQRLADHIAPWAGRELFLDISPEAERIVLTEEGASFHPLPGFLPTEEGHREKNLHCHYQISLTEREAEFTLWRTEADLPALLQEADGLGIRHAVGLFQEWDSVKADPFPERCVPHNRRARS